jgi:hypothetical protein
MWRLPSAASSAAAGDVVGDAMNIMDMDADGNRWRALADYLIKHMAKRQQLLAASVDALMHGSALWGKVL